MTKKERYLAVATPEEWDRWLSHMADFYASRIDSVCFYQSNKINCLFCEAFNNDCRLCAGAKYRHDISCMDISYEERIDRAIVKLNRARVFK